MIQLLKYFPILLIYVLSSPSLLGQVNDSRKALRVGERFVAPQNLKFMRGTIESLDWGQWNQKLVVLDFFDTYCGTCIQAMPHLQQLTDHYGDKIVVLNVTYQDRPTLEKFFENNLFLKEHEVNLPVIYGDTQLKAMFPFKAAPHVVVIHQGKVKAITFSRMLTVDNIDKLLADKAITLPLKDDFGILNLSNSDSNTSLGVWISGFQEGVPSAGLKIEKDTITGLTRSMISNRSILRTLLNVWATIEKPDFLVNSDRILWRVRDSSKYDDLRHEGEAWGIKNAICYERLDHMIRSDVTQARIILDDLHSLLGIRSYWQSVERPCLLLQRCKVRTPQEISRRKQRVKGTNVLAGLLAFSGNYPPVIDRVNSKMTLEIASYNNLDELNEQLRGYGMELVRGVGPVDMFVVEEEE